MDLLKIKHFLIQLKNKLQICIGVSVPYVDSHSILVIPNPLEVNCCFPLRFHNCITQKKKKLITKRRRRRKKPEVRKH